MWSCRLGSKVSRVTQSDSERPEFLLLLTGSHLQPGAPRSPSVLTCPHVSSRVPRLKQAALSERLRVSRLRYAESCRTTVAADGHTRAEHLDVQQSGGAPVLNLPRLIPLFPPQLSHSRLRRQRPRQREVRSSSQVGRPRPRLANASERWSGEEQVKLRCSSSLSTKLCSPPLSPWSHVC